MRRKKSPVYLDWIRQLPCCLCGDNTSVEAAHIRMPDRRAGKRQTGKGEKPDDCWAIPVCGRCHREQHKFGEKEFWRDLDPIRLSMALQLNAFNTPAAEGIIEAWRTWPQSS